MEHLRNKPNRLWILDTFPLLDRSGYITPATITVSGNNITNLITNPSGRVNTAGWNNIGQGTIARNAGAGVDGNGYFTITVVSVVADSGASQNFTAVIGTTYSASWMARNSGASSINVRGRHSGGTQNYTIPNDNVWRNYTYTWTASLTSEFFRPTEFYTTGTLNGAVDVDMVILTATPAPVAYFDGDTVDANNTYAWTGTANASTSVQSISTFGISLSSHSSRSLLTNSTNYVTFPQNVFISGLQAQEFSLAASIFVPDVGSVSNQQVLSNLSQTDGLWINGNTINFSTVYASTGSATASYILPVGQDVDVVGVHTNSKNLLYINGICVDSVDILNTQQADVYITTNGNLYAGRLGTQNLLINMVATYPRALHADEILAMYQENSRVSTTDPYVAYVGEVIDVTADSRPTFLNTGWYTADDWTDASLQHVFVDEDDALRPEMIGTLTMAGIWQDAVNLYNGDTATTIDSVNLYWTGQNVLVEASVNGTSWETVTRGVNLTSTPSGFDPTGKALFIRATFTQGVTSAYIQNLTVRGYTSNTAQQFNGRIITYTNPTVTFDDKQPSLLRDDWGTKSLGGAIDIGTDTISALPMTVKTVEVWIKQLTGTSPTFSSNLTTGSIIYTNGAVGSTIRRGEWNVQHYTKSAGFTGDLVFTGQVQIGRVVIYDSVLSATQIANVVANYTGTLVSNRSSGGPITVAEHSPPAVIYAHDWSTTS